MKKTCLLLTLCILTFFAGILQAQNKVEIKLKQPPPGQLNIENLWSFTLRNNTNERLEVYLKGSATEEKDGLIATGKTVSITLNAKETKNMKVSDLPRTPDIDYKAKNPKYKESLIRQGKFPEGNYEICVNVYSSETNEELGNDCINQEVKETGLITLISPEDGEEIDSKIQPAFIWTGKPGDSYKIKIVEVLGNQSPEIAIEKNKAFFKKEELRTTTFTYPTTENNFEEGKKYAWVVSSGEVKSEVWMFAMGTNSYKEIIIDSARINCTKQSNNYTFTLYVKNINVTGWMGSGCPSANAIITSITGSTTCSGSSSVVNVNTFAPSVISNSGTVAISGTMTSLCPLSYIDITINSSDQTCVGTSSNPNKYKASGQQNIEVGKCPCCDGFTKLVNGITVGGSPNAVLEAKLTAGPSLIKKVTAEMVYFYQKPNDVNCTKCINDNNQRGTFINPPSNLSSLVDFGNGSFPTYAGTDGYCREIIFNSASGVNMMNGKQVSLKLGLPPASSLTCCADTIRMCIRFSFTNAECIKCDTLICIRIRRTSNSIGAGGIQGLEIITSESSDDVIKKNIEKNVNVNIEIPEKEKEIKNLADSYVFDGHSLEFERTGDENQCCYKLFVNNTTDLITYNAFKITTSVPMIVTGPPGGSTITYTQNNKVIKWQKYQGIQPGRVMYGTICFTNPPSPFSLNIQWSTNSGSSFSGNDKVELTCSNISKDPPNSNNCCNGFDIIVSDGGRVLQTTDSPIPQKYFDQRVKISAGPNKIKRIRISMPQFSLIYSNPDCQVCQKNPFQWGALAGQIEGNQTPFGQGNFTVFPNVPLSGNDNLIHQNTREILWESSTGALVQNIPFLLYIHIPVDLVLPLNCCDVQLKYCLKYEFTDTDCNTCDTTICYTYDPKPNK